MSVDLPATMERRHFLAFMGAATTLAMVAEDGFAKPPVQALPFTPLTPNGDDQLSLANGFVAGTLISWGDVLNKSGQTFGADNDYIAFLRPKGTKKDEAVLWINHESCDPLFISGRKPGEPRLKEKIQLEQQAVGGSFVKIKKTKGVWQVVANDVMNTRVDATTPIAFNNGNSVMGQISARGTLGNCAGGYTPWGSVLTCEENYHHYYGEVSFDEKGQRTVKRAAEDFGWADVDAMPPEHYGWVVELDPTSRKYKKLTGLGRFAHEGATVVKAGKQLVVYMGDDTKGQCIYKFISKTNTSLDDGTLYVANVKEGKWIPLDVAHNPELKTKFGDQLSLLIRTREAAKMVGGTPMDRPEDIEIHPESGDIYLTLTNNPDVGNMFGSILKIKEQNGDHLNLKFTSETFMSGGAELGFACPDNLVFDKRGNIWMTCDVSETAMHKDPYASFGSNALFYIPLQGPHAGKAYRVAIAPRDAEFTGPCFSDDGKTLFLSVQHPGASTKDRAQPTSTWNKGKHGLPRSAVVTIQGPAMEQLMRG